MPTLRVHPATANMQSRIKTNRPPMGSLPLKVLRHADAKAESGIPPSVGSRRTDHVTTTKGGVGVQQWRAEEGREPGRGLLAHVAVDSTGEGNANPLATRCSSANWCAGLLGSGRRHEFAKLINRNG